MKKPAFRRPPETPGSWHRVKTAPFLILVVLALDQLTKLCVRECLSLGESIPDGSRLRLTYVVNPGMFFGAGGSSSLTLLLPLAMILGALVIYWGFRRSRSILLKVGTGLFIGGTLGNLIDRILWGHVTDFIEVFSSDGDASMVFNLADLCIVAGILVLEAFLIRFIIRAIREKGMHYNPVKPAMARIIRRMHPRERR